MKNEIKKIILSMDGKNLNGFVVVRDNKVEPYGYGKMIKEELLNKYSKLILELKEQNKDNLNGLNNQDAVNKLYLLGKLEYSDKNLITKITNCFDSEENIEKIIVNYIDRQEEIKLKDCNDEADFYEKFKEKLVEMCKTYEIKLDNKDDLTEDFIEKLNLMGLLEDKQEGKIVDDKVSTSLVATDDETYSKKEILTGAKIKNFVVNHKLLSGLIATGVIGLILSTHGCHKKTNNNQTEVINLNNDDYIETQVDYVYEEELPTVEPLEYFKEISFANEEMIFPCYIETSDDTLIAKEYSGKSYNVFDSYYGNKDNLIAVRNENMSNVANYIQSDIKIKDQGIYIYHENLFDNNLRDKAFVKYFSMFGNQIIKNAYQNKEYGLVIDNAIKSDEELIRLINNNEPLEVYIYGEKQYIYFNELSHDAKEMVLNIAWTNNLPLNKSIVLSGYNQDDISSIILEQADMLNMIR